MDPMFKKRKLSEIDPIELEEPKQEILDDEFNDESMQLLQKNEIRLLSEKAQCLCIKLDLIWEELPKQQFLKREEVIHAENTLMCMYHLHSTLLKRNKLDKTDYFCSFIIRYHCLLRRLGEWHKRQKNLPLIPMIEIGNFLTEESLFQFKKSIFLYFRATKTRYPVLLRDMLALKQSMDENEANVLISSILILSPKERIEVGFPPFPPDVNPMCFEKYAKENDLPLPSQMGMEEWKKMFSENAKPYEYVEKAPNIERSESELLVLNKDTCTVCLETMSGAHLFRTHCGHFFHSNCINQWCKQNLTQKEKMKSATCPTCRQKI